MKIRFAIFVMQVGSSKVLCALSGGVDSSVVAILLHKAIGDQLTCMFIDHGLLRKDEAESVMETFVGKFDMKVIKIDASERFLGKLKGVEDPEQKRKIIGNEFIYVFQEESDKFDDLNSWHKELFTRISWRAVRRQRKRSNLIITLAASRGH